uniref:Uncharacterized protein n=1 Tax=Phlebotomus papatasi TaxID=29031 RepID=A0A1B0D4J7_PHLPP
MAGATLFERAQAISSVNREEGISLLNKIVREQEVAENDEELIRIKEQGILQLGELYKQEGKAKELADLIKVTRPFLSLISKAKAAKLVRSLVDLFLDLEAGTGIEVQLCKECIEWAKQEKRTFLRQSLEARLIALYFDTGMYTEALALGSQLLKELKKLDDKNLLVEVQLLESKTYHALSNLPKKYPKQLRTRGDVYSAAFSDDECDVYVCHMNEIDPQYYERYRNQSEIIQQTPPKKDAIGKVSPRTVATENSPQKENELHLFRKFPTKSKMDEEIHMSCIRYLKSLEDPEECAESQINHSDQEQYLSCEEIRKQEKTEFYEFVKNYFMTHLRQRILKIDVGMENILIERWQRDVEDVKKKQQQNYQLQTALPLDYCLPENAEVHLENQEEALRLGVVPRMIYDFSATETLKLEQNPEKLKSYMGVHANFKGNEDERALERIAQKDEIDVILPLDSIEKFEVCRILVKFHQDGVVLGDDGEEAINFSLKIEYQTEFGAEEMTIEELIREWCQQTFNPNSRTLRIRIDFQTLKILSVKEISLKDIEKDLQRLHGISSKELLQRLWGILSVMKNFPIQNYLMHHESIHDRKVKIYASRETGEHDKNFLQLSQLFAKVDFKRKPLLEQHDWIPIDDQEVTILHEQKNVMPCAFPHWGKAESVNIWNEKKNLIEKYEARMKAKTEAKLLQERKIKSEKNRKKN